MPDAKNPVLLYAFPDLELPVVDANVDIQQAIYTTVFSDRSAFPDLAGFAKPFVQVMFEGTTTKTHFYLQRLSLGATATGTGSQAAYWMLLSGIKQRSAEPSNKKQKKKGPNDKDTFSILLPLTQTTGLSQPDPLLPLATALQRGTSVAHQTRVPVTLSSFAPLSLHTGTYDVDNAMLTLPAHGLTQQTIALLSTVFTSVSDPHDVMRMPRASVYEFTKEKKEKKEGFGQQEGFREGAASRSKCTINQAGPDDKPFKYSLENASFDAGNLMLVLCLLAVGTFFVSDGLLGFLASLYAAFGVPNTLSADPNRPLHFAHATMVLSLMFIIGTLMAIRQYSNMTMFIVMFIVYYSKASSFFTLKRDQDISIKKMYFNDKFVANFMNLKAIPFYIHLIFTIISFSLLSASYYGSKDDETKDEDSTDALFISGIVTWAISFVALGFSFVLAMRE